MTISNPTSTSATEAAEQHSCLGPEWRESVGMLMAEVSRLFRAAFAEALVDSALTFAQAKALIYVARFEGARQVDLADKAELQPMTMARLIDDLVQQQLVERRVCPDDRRAYRIYLRPEAVNELQLIRQCGDLVQQQAMQGLDKNQMVQILQQMRHNLLQN